MNLFIVLSIFVVAIECIVRPKYSERCNIRMEFAKSVKNMYFYCLQTNRTEMTCRPICIKKGEGVTEPAKYKCKVTPGVRGGKWLPEHLPKCKQKCKFRELTRGKRVNSTCLPIENGKICTVSCNGKFKTPPADEYKCITTPEHPTGIWTSEVVPRCIRKDCKFRKLTQDENVLWQCSRRYSWNQKFCRVRCGFDFKFETPPADEYTCTSTPDNPDGIWIPNAVPRCIPKGLRSYRI